MLFFKSTLKGLFFLLAISCLNSCGLFSEEEVKPMDNSELSAFKSGNGFVEIAVLNPKLLNQIKGVGGGFRDSYSLADMTISEDGSTLYVATWEKSAHQLSNFGVTFDRLNVNLSDGSIDSVPPISWRIDNNLGIRFLPYSQKMYQTETTYSNNGTSKSYVHGDFSYSRSSGGSYVKQPRVTVNEEIVEEVYADNIILKGGSYRNRLFFIYQNRDATQREYSFSKYPGNSTSTAIYSAVIEPKGINAEKLMMLGVSEEYLYAIEIPVDATLESNTSYIIPSAVDSIPIPESWTKAQLAIRIAEDQKRIGITLRNSVEPFEFTTASYDMESKKLTINNDNLAIPNYGTGLINYDFDENGNIWFDNYGNEFQADSIISVYKASQNNFSTVGEDLLAGGSITSFRYLKGKIYAIVNYGFEEGGFKYHRMSIIREQ
ncbi:MAG: hypothetical protein JXR10_00105 [Cyclobacteriaceae bacterium]